LRFMVFSSVSDMKGLFCKMAGQACVAYHLMLQADVPLYPPISELRNGGMKKGGGHYRRISGR